MPAAFRAQLDELPEAVSIIHFVLIGTSAVTVAAVTFYFVSLRRRGRSLPLLSRTLISAAVGIGWIPIGYVGAMLGDLSVTANAAIALAMAIITFIHVAQHLEHRSEP
ncbi:hypothetical protein [Leifsonia sp. Leaf264]|uniref:hypothetical protein n=1 Tax=Leifsonia sp. Leaf264 TaxID=1736314 RepID=UPI0012F93F1F|nr:hypothetical protein [Leifsonia sp. Leaf264]